jgi:hypothetical protein
MGRNELARTVAERSGLSREESADLTRAVPEAVAGQLSNGEARRLGMKFPDFVAQPWTLPASWPHCGNGWARTVTAISSGSSPRPTRSWRSRRADRAPVFVKC